MQNDKEGLSQAISRLEEKRSKDLVNLKAEVDSSIESLKPMNLIRNTIDNIASTPKVKGNILGSLVGIGTGLLSRKLMIGGSHNPIKRVVGTMLQFAIARTVSKHANGVRSKGRHIIHRFLKNRRESRNEVQDFNQKM